MKFLKQTTVKPNEERRELNRIATSEMLKKYYKWLETEYPEESQRQEKVGETEFVRRVRKQGYQTNTGYINKEVIKENGKTKIEHIGNERVLYVADVKWLAGVNLK